MTRMAKRSIVTGCVGLAAILFQVAAGSARAEDAPADDAGTLARADALEARAVELCEAGMYADAEPLARECLELRERLLGPEHPDLGRILDTLAFALGSQGRYDAALPLHERALAIWEKAVGPENPKLADALDAFSYVLRELGRYDEARPLVARATGIREKALGPEHPDVASGLYSLALLDQAKGRYDSARPLFERALRIWEKVLGPDHPDVASCLTGLASLLQSEGQLDAARPLFERAAEIFEKALGPDHPNVGIALTNLASLLQAQGRFDSARSLFERARAILERALGPHHPDLATILAKISSLLKEEGRYEAARPLCERALEIAEKALGPDHPAVGACLNNLASLLDEQGQREAARPLYERALGIAEKALGPGHPSVAACRINLASLHQAQGQYDAARPLYERAVRDLEATFGPDHPEVATGINNLASMLRLQGQYDAARPLQERALRIWEQVLGPDHPSVAVSLNNLASLHYLQGRLDTALPLYERALRIREASLGADHPDLAWYLYCLGRVLETQGRDREAREIHDRALRIAEGSIRRALGGLHGPERLRSIAKSRYLLDNWLALAPRVGDSGYEAVLRIRGLVTRVESGERAVARRGGELARSRIEEILALDRQLGGVAARIPPEAEGREGWKRRCAELSARREATLFALARDCKPLQGALKRLDLGFADVRDRLGESEVLVDLLRVPDAYLAFVVTSGEEVKRVVLGSASEIDAAAAAFVVSVSRGERASGVRMRGLEMPAGASGDGGRRLAELVFAPIRMRLPKGATRIYLCPDAALAAVPFAALPGERPGTFLIDEFEIVHLEMAQDLVPPPAPPRPGAGALVVGGVDFEKAETPPASAPSPLPVEVDRAPADGSRWSPLPGTLREAESLHRRLPGDLLAGPAATEDRLRALCRGKAVLHLATHGYVREEGVTRTLKALAAAGKFDAAVERQMAVGVDPMLLAGVALAGADRVDGGTGDDGLLTAAEVSWLDLEGVRLAVLSACETGRGSAAAGEGTLGLVRGFRLAGARTVVASLWRVDDTATAMLMERFYDGYLDRGLEPAAALRAAALAVRGYADPEGRRPFAAPRYWAAFVAYGK